MSHNINTNNFSGPSFSIQNRLARVCWNMVYLILFRLSPISFFGWRIMLLKVFGAKVGKGVHVYPGVKIWAPWNLEIGDYSGIASGSILYSQAKITIGKKVVISQGAYLCAGTHDYTDPGFRLITKPIFVSDYSWIATETFIHPGVIIGEGVVIGARSVVTKDLPSWMVCTGHPCLPVKERKLEIVKK
jgi:putative colanic acid biosynthesis acetyltransferase WcaF